MSPEDRELLQASLRLAEENNEILRAIKRSMQIQRVMSILYWVFIIGSAVGAYYFVQPYVDQIINLYTGAGDVLDNIKQIGS